jgi:hypothetical protein
MKAIKTGNMPEKITAHALALSSMVQHLGENSVIKKNLSTKALRVLSESFGDYADAQAYMSPESLHHVYEWNRTGNSDARLFKGKVSNGVLSFSFLPSKSISDTSKEPFTNKAYVMERGAPIVISPKNSNVLVFEVDGEVVFTPNSVTVDNPGGAEVAGSFERIYRGWIRSNLPMLSLIDAGFFKSLTRAQLMAVTKTINPYAKRTKTTGFANSVGKQAAVEIERMVK